MGYGKFWASCFQGSMLGAGSDVFAIWGYVIANTIKGTVELNPAYLAAIIGMPKERVQKAIDYLCAPDSNSRSSDEEGRRLVKEGQFLYRMVNHYVYRDMKDEDELREYNRMKKRESRERNRNDNPE